MEVRQRESHDEIIMYRAYNSVMEVESARALLAASGIWSDINSEYMSLIYPGVIQAQLMVRSEDSERVKELLGY